MKKYLPVVIMVMTFCAFLIAQVGWDMSDIYARQGDIEKKKFAHYESVFSKSEFQTFKGKAIKLSEVQAPIVILNFWASWCVPCLDEMPSLKQLRDKFHHHQLYVLGINSDEDEQNKNIKKIVDKYNINFPIIPDRDGTILEDFLITAIPVTIIFYRGKVLEVKQGVKNFADSKIISRFQKLIDKDSLN